ncbi:MAG: ribokinase [Phycisphaerae bacterium]|nr:ribokinase [Phycisphaerae bacterium]
MAKDSILVVGSINMDMVVRVKEMPAPGETVLGGGFGTTFGGKGANQAVAAARLGGKCRLIAAVGEDEFGPALRENLQKEGVDCSALAIKHGVPSGVAMILVDSNGENSIVVASGANYRVTPDDDLFPNEHLFAEASVVVLQLELPLPTVRAAIELARRHHCQILLDPAPAPAAMCDELCRVDVLTPNVIEAERISGARAGDESADKLIASAIIQRGAKNVILKLGGRGSLVVTADGHFYTAPPFKVPIVDTTAAGDAFTAALAVAMSRGDRLRDAARFANAAGALACTKLGAQTAMPTAQEVSSLLRDQPQ